MDEKDKNSIGLFNDTQQYGHKNKKPLTAVKKKGAPNQGPFYKPPSSST